MFSSLKRPLVTLAVTAGLLAVAGPASAGTTTEPKGGPPTKTGSSFLDMGTFETWTWQSASGSPARAATLSQDPASRPTLAPVASQADGNEGHPRRAAKRRELKRRISCAINNGWMADRPTRVVIRAFKAGNPTVVSAIAAAGPQVCM